MCSVWRAIIVIVHPAQAPYGYGVWRDDEQLQVEGIIEAKVLAHLRMIRTVWLYLCSIVRYTEIAFILEGFL